MEFHKGQEHVFLTLDFIPESIKRKIHIFCCCWKNQSIRYNFQAINSKLCCFSYIIYSHFFNTSMRKLWFSHMTDENAELHEDQWHPKMSEPLAWLKKWRSHLIPRGRYNFYRLYLKNQYDTFPHLRGAESPVDWAPLSWAWLTVSFPLFYSGHKKHRAHWIILWSIKQILSSLCVLHWVSCTVWYGHPGFLELSWGLGRLPGW